MASCSRSRRYVGYVFGLGFYYCALFAFIAGSPFVYIEHFGVSPQILRLPVRRQHRRHDDAAASSTRASWCVYGSDRLLRVGMSVGLAGGVVLAVTGTQGIGGISGVAIPSFIVLSMLSMIGANAISGALALFPHRAGSAAALSGALQFGMGALVGRDRRLARRRHARPDGGGDGRLGRDRAVAQSRAGAWR